MTTTRTPTRAALLTLALCSSALSAQTATEAAPAPKPHVTKPKPARPAAPVMDANLILLDPAHGGLDPGGKLGNVPEKEVNLAFAYRLRSALQARGFTVLLTREADPVAQPAPAAQPDQPAPPPPPPPPQATAELRAETANRAHPLACLILHTTAAGRGVHLYTSALTEIPPVSSGFDGSDPIQLWDTAQAAILPQSLRMSNDLTQSLSGLRVPMIVGHASIGPIDSMTCPAAVLEIAPISPNGGQTTPATDAAYQQRVAEAIATAMTFWRGHSEAYRPTPVTPAPAAPVEAKPAPKPKPKPKPAAPDNPDAAPAPKPVPIIRKPPATPAPGASPAGAR